MCWGLELCSKGSGSYKLLQMTKHSTNLGLQVSGRSWKQAGERAGTLRNPKLSTSWDEKMRIKAEKAAFLEQKRESQAAWKAKKGVSPWVLGWVAP